MYTENSVVIHAPLARIFAYGAQIGDWPRHLPHYRWITVHSDDGRVKQATMAARRDWFPVRWRTSQVLLPEENKILFFHTGGISRGMYVEWILQDLPAEEGGGVRVTITHDLTYPLPWLTHWFAHGIVGNLFVSSIAGRTLATFKELAEREATATDEVTTGRTERYAPVSA